MNKTNISVVAFFMASRILWAGVAFDFFSCSMSETALSFVQYHYSKLYIFSILFIDKYIHL